MLVAVGWLAGQTDWDTLRPEPFQWPLFLVALTLMAVPSLMATWPEHRKRTQPVVLKTPLMREKVKRTNCQNENCHKNT